MVCALQVEGAAKHGAGCGCLSTWLCVCLWERMLLHVKLRTNSGKYYRMRQSRVCPSCCARKDSGVQSYEDVMNRDVWIVPRQVPNVTYSTATRLQPRGVVCYHVMWKVLFSVAPWANGRAFVGFVSSNSLLGGCSVRRAISMSVMLCLFWSTSRNEIRLLLVWVLLQH